MGLLSEFKIGEVVVLLFPFSDLSHEKFRPALIVGFSDYGNIIVSQITSKLPSDGTGIVLSNNHFENTKPLKRDSYIRHNKIFTADPKLIFKSLGIINRSTRLSVHAKITKTLKELAEV